MIKTPSLVRQHLIFNAQPIREAAKKWYSFAHSQEAIIFDEMYVEQGKARIDMVAVGQHLHGFEFKSDGDTLNRIYHQMHYYNLAFERLTLIVGYSHLYEAIEIVPQWWGIVVVEQTVGGSVTFDSIRKSLANPKLSSCSVLSLLTKYEISKLAEDIGLKVISTASFDRLVREVSSFVTACQLIELVKSSLVSRTQLNQAFEEQ